MNVQIAKIIKDKLIDLPYFDKVAGLVQTITKEDAGESKTKIIKFPVEVDLSVPNLTPMIPDESIKGMFYLEDGGMRCDGNSDYTSELNLICWFNPKKIAKEVESVGVNALADISNSLKNYFNEGPISRLKISIVSVPARSSDIFSKYSYSETQTQYLMPPYDFFAIKLKATFRLSNSCLTTLNSSEPC